MFEALFNFPLELFRQGTLTLAYGWPAYLLAAGIAAAVAIALAGYLHRATAPARARLTLGALRAAWVALLVLALFSPELNVTVPQPFNGNLALLLDDSQSMRIADTEAGARSQRLRELFAPGTGSVSSALAQRHFTRYFGFGAAARALQPTSELSFGAPRSDLAEALRQVRSGETGYPPAAVVLVSDGGDGATPALADELLAYRASGIAVYTVGVGAPRHARDLELNAVSLPGGFIVDDTFMADVRLRQRGSAGAAATLRVAYDGLLIHRQAFKVPGRDEFTLPVGPIALPDTGVHRLSFSVAMQTPDDLEQNDARELALRVPSEPAPVLHFEGEPRFEVKFVRRALSEDRGLHLVSLIRTAENKYYRIGVEDAGELAGGFPRDPQALFRYRALVLGSVEANLLSGEQQALLRDFVARRGGSLLLLGARRAFAEGGHAGGELASMLPVALQARDSGFRAAVQVSPTLAGRTHPVIQSILQAAPDAVLAGLPALTVVNPLRDLKPGASLLLQGHTEADDRLVVLAYQRYGRGTVAVLGARDTWRWQLNGEVAVDDLTHETLWRQLLRWLARDVPPAVELRLTPPSPAPGDTVTVATRPQSDAFEPLAQAQLTLSVTDPAGAVLTRAFEAGRDGWYQAQFVVPLAGVYELQASRARDDGRAPQQGAAVINVAPAGEEYFDAELDRALLQGIARQTGGRYLDAADAHTLPALLAARPGQAATLRQLALRDAPILYLTILLLALAEWLLRRRWRLP